MYFYCIFRSLLPVYYPVVVFTVNSLFPTPSITSCIGSVLLFPLSHFQYSALFSHSSFPYPQYVHILSCTPVFSPVLAFPLSIPSVLPSALVFPFLYCTPNIPVFLGVFPAGISSYPDVCLPYSEYLLWCWYIGMFCIVIPLSRS
jgi:hypothetical protein